MKTWLFVASNAAFCFFASVEALGQAPDWAQPELQAISVEPVSTSESMLERFSNQMPIPETIQDFVPDRGKATSTPAVLMQNVGAIQTKSSVHSDRSTVPWTKIDQHAATAQPTNIQASTPHRQPSGKLPIQVVSHGSQSATLELIPHGCCVESHIGYPGYPAGQISTYGSTYSPTLISSPQVSQITKRSFSYGDFGARTYHQMSTQTGYRSSSTTWSW